MNKQLLKVYIIVSVILFMAVESDEDILGEISMLVNSTGNVKAFTHFDEFKNNMDIKCGAETNNKKRICCLGISVMEYFVIATKIIYMDFKEFQDEAKQLEGELRAQCLSYLETNIIDVRKGNAKPNLFVSSIIITPTLIFIVIGIFIFLFLFCKP